MSQRPEKLSFEEQLSILAGCGISLKPGISKDILFKGFDRNVYEHAPFIPLLTMMGAGEGEFGENICENVWSFDTECINDHGDYAEIAKRLRDLAGGALPLENIKDYVDVKKKEAWLSFVLDGKSYKWTARVDDDWADPNIVASFSALLDNRKAGKRFALPTSPGQDFIIVCCTGAQLECLNQRTGYTFDWCIGNDISNLIVWLLAFAPIIGTAIEQITGKALSVNPNYLFFTTIILNVGFSTYDARMLGKAGYDTTPMGSAWLVPVYLYERAKILKQNKAYFIVWCILFTVYFFFY